MLRTGGEDLLLRNTGQEPGRVRLPLTDGAPDAAGAWQDFQGRLLGFVSRRVAAEADAEDIVQKVFLQLHRNLPRLRGSERLGPWLYQAARNAIADHYRAPVRRREIASGGITEIEPLAGGADEQRDEDGMDAAECLRPLIARLSETDRRAIELIEFQGLPQKDAAVAEGQSLTAMKIWAALGVVMSAVLYEPAFAALTRSFEGERRRRALTTVTLLAGLASTIFVPLATYLLAGHGWRTATLVLAAVLALFTIPVHGSLLPGGAWTQDDTEHTKRAGSGSALRSGNFWVLTGSFVLAGFVSASMSVHAVSYFASRGLSSAEGAAMAAALGFMQLPARLMFVPIASRVPSAWVAPGVLALQAGGLALLLCPAGDAAVVAFVAAFGMGNGLTTLVRPTLLAEEFGSREYATLGGVMAAPVTAARASGPVATALLHEWRDGYEGVIPILLAALVLAVVALVPRAVRRQRQAACGSDPAPKTSITPWSIPAR